MAKQIYTKNVIIPDVALNIDNVIDIHFKRGVRTDIKDISSEMGYTDMAFYKAMKKAPKIISALHYYLKKHNMKFEDFVKELPR